jgi:hypothetical protein
LIFGRFFLDYTDKSIEDSIDEEAMKTGAGFFAYLTIEYLRSRR